MTNKNSTNVYELIGKRIREERKMKQLSMEKLAELSEITPSFLGHIERGERKLSVDTLNKISNALKISPGDLMTTNKNFKNKNLSWENKICILIGNQPEKNKAILFKILKYVFSNLRLTRK